MKSLTVHNRSLYYFNEFAKAIMEQVKFKGDARLLDCFKNEVKLWFHNHYPPHEYVLLPTPITRKRLVERGFNQVTYLINELNYEKLDFFLKLNNKKQSKKTKRERLQLEKQFSIKEGMGIEGKKVLIVDDIYTTGATIHNMARELYVSKHIEKIEAFTLFRG